MIEEYKAYKVGSLRIDLFDRVLVVADRRVDFGRKAEVWDLFVYLIEQVVKHAGGGIHEDDVLEYLWPEFGEKPTKIGRLKETFGRLKVVFPEAAHLVVWKDHIFKWTVSVVPIISAPQIPRTIEIDVLTRSRRRCCLCFGLERDFRQKRGRVVWVGQDSTKTVQSDFIFLCQKHDAEEFPVQELKVYGDQLYGEITRFDEVTAEARRCLWDNQETKALKSLLDLVRDFRIEERLTTQLLDTANTQGPDLLEPEKVRQRVIEIIDSLQAQRDGQTRDTDMDDLSPDWRGRLRDTPQTSLQGTPAVTGEHISLVFASANAIPFTLRCDKLNITFGQITAVLGRNSSGKSTLLRIIAGELRPQLGKLDFHGVGTPNDWYSIKQRIAYVSQTPQSWYGTVAQQLAFEAAATGKRAVEVDKAVEMSLVRFDLYPYYHTGWGSLSPGIVTRFELARAVLRDAMILVLDEPLAHLDLAGRETFLDDLWGLTRDRNRPTAVVISSQHIQEVERITDHVMFLDQGEVTVDPVFNSDFSYLELSCSGDLEALRHVLGESVVIQARNTNGLYWIKHPNGDKPRVIALLLELGIDIYYVRDISHSFTRLFE